MYRYLIGAEEEPKQKYLWELLLELSNWQCYLKDYYHYGDIKNNKHRRDLIEDIIDKLSTIRFLVEDVKKHIIIKGIKEAEKETIVRIMSHVELGVTDLSEKVKHLF